MVGYCLWRQRLKGEPSYYVNGRAICTDLYKK